ncbi:MAG: hypothetical protein IT290_06495, partial [Deltaproteobacteria bacterium]|nr:hypothetical protein [Deltaproteobacteria bacterium]
MNSSLLHSAFELPTDHGRSIRADVRWCPADAPRPLVVICHGFKGFKEWGFHPYFGAELAHAGFVAVSVNFSHNGVGADLMSFTDREGFRANTISREAEELERVLDFAHDSNHWLSRLVDTRNIGLIGHSRAGYAVFTVGSRREDVGAIAGLAAVSELNVEPEREK